MTKNRWLHLMTRSLIIVASLNVATARVNAQVRNLPVFFEPSYSYDGRIGIDVGHAGEADGFTVVAGGSYLFYVGNCRRVALTASAGIWNPPGGDFEAQFNGGAAASVLVNPCPSPLTVSNTTVRVIAGAGIVRSDGRNVVNVPLGIGVGYMLPVPIFRVEPWVTPRIHYRESLLAAGDSEWDFAFSIGTNIGLGATAGLRVALDCCEGGVGGSYGLSLWF